MAYTKIHAIKATVDKAIDYICNPEKTDEKMFVSSYACSPETAAYDFKYTLDHCRENSPNKAYHLIQAFAPGEVGFEEAHRIGKELADKLLEGKYSYIVTTHIDKGHVHNHIIFCAADNIEHNKYHDCKQSYYHIRKLSDELCREHNLSVINDHKQCKSKCPKDHTFYHFLTNIIMAKVLCHRHILLPFALLIYCHLCHLFHAFFVDHSPPHLISIAFIIA